MVPLPLFKFAALFVRHISKYGANWIKVQAHEHPKFRTIAARYGQTMHQINMRMAVTLLRDEAAEKRFKEKAEAPTVKTEEQMRHEEAVKQKQKQADREKDGQKEAPKSVWKRKFRALPENKAVDLFADVVGDTFILVVAGSLILYEYIRAKGKPDVNAERLAELKQKMEELDRREKELEESEEKQKARVETLEEVVEEMRKANGKNWSPSSLLVSKKFRLLSLSTPLIFLNIFCSSLRKRQEWATVPDTLLSIQQARWCERDLKIWDLAIEIPQLHQGDTQESFLLMLLSPMDLRPDGNAMARIEKLYHHSGGRNVGILFLIREKTLQGNGTITLMDLQASLLSTFEVPVMPLSALSSLEQTLANFQRQLVNTRTKAARPRVNPLVDLLPYCTSNPPIPEHQRNILSEICHNLPSLAEAATTPDGQKAIRNLLSETPKVAEDILGFWREESIVD